MFLKCRLSYNRAECLGALVGLLNLYDKTFVDGTMRRVRDRQYWCNRCDFLESVTELGDCERLFSWETHFPQCKLLMCNHYISLCSICQLASYPVCTVAVCFTLIQSSHHNVSSQITAVSVPISHGIIDR